MAEILITDDHPFFRMGLQAVLEADGHTVVGAVGDASDTKAAIDELQPEIILLDIRLSGLDGVALLQELRKAGDQRPVIIVTVEMTDDQLLAAMQAGVNGIVFKHEGERRILDAIETVRHGGRFIDGAILDQAFSLASRGSAPSQLDELSEKEKTIARHVAAGLKNREIAEHLDTTEGTIKVHLHRIYTKCKVANRAELATMVALESQSATN